MAAAARGTTAGDPLIDEGAGPTNARAEPNRRRGFSRIDEPAKVTSTDAEQVGELCRVEHGNGHGMSSVVTIKPPFGNVPQGVR